jgi:hypothetical protein
MVRQFELPDSISSSSGVTTFFSSIALSFRFLEPPSAPAALAPRLSPGAEHALRRPRPENLKGLR